jgi:hypothetical protein
MGSLARRDFLQRKVVLKVHVPSLSLPPAVQQRLADLVGTRYDARSGWLKLVGDKHPNRHLNQKYLTLLMRELLNESFLADSRYAFRSSPSDEQRTEESKTPGTLTLSCRWSCRVCHVSCPHHKTGSRHSPISALKIRRRFEGSTLCPPTFRAFLVRNHSACPTPSHTSATHQS